MLLILYILTVSFWYIIIDLSCKLCFACEAPLADAYWQWLGVGVPVTAYKLGETHLVLLQPVYNMKRSPFSLFQTPCQRWEIDTNLHDRNRSKYKVMHSGDDV